MVWDYRLQIHHLVWPHFVGVQRLSASPPPFNLTLFCFYLFFGHLQGGFLSWPPLSPSQWNFSFFHLLLPFSLFGWGCCHACLYSLSYSNWSSWERRHWGVLCKCRYVQFKIDYNVVRECKWIASTPDLVDLNLFVRTEMFTQKLKMKSTQAFAHEAPGITGAGAASSPQQSLFSTVNKHCNCRDTQIGDIFSHYQQLSFSFYMLHYYFLYISRYIYFICR